MKKLLVVTVCLAVFAGFAAQAHADNQQALERQLDLLMQRLEAQQRSIEDMEGRLQQAEDPALRARVLEYERDLVDLRNELRQGAGSDVVPGWLTKDLKFDASVRVRYDVDVRKHRRYYRDNIVPLDTLKHAYWMDDYARNRGRYQLRFGFQKQFGEEWSAGFRLVSTQGDATSQNQTFTNYFQEQPVGIDRAWIMYQPQFLPGLKLAGGKFANPFVSTNMVWDTDVSPEGVYATMEFADVADGIVPFFTVAHVVARELAFANDITMQGYQIGVKWDVTPDVKATFAATHYNWNGFENATADGYGGLLTTGHNASVWPNGYPPLYHVRGNTVTLRPAPIAGGAVPNPAGFAPYFDAGDFNIWNITGFLDFDVNIGERLVPLRLFSDFAWNAATEGKVSNPALMAPTLAAVPQWVPNGGLRRDLRHAHSFGARIGQAKQQGDLQFSYRWTYIEANSVVGYFSDSDFGYANRKGHVFGARYMLSDNVYLGSNVFFTRQMYDPDNLQTWQPRFQFDVGVTF